MRAARVERIDRIPIEIPFREVPGRNLYRQSPGWKYFEIFEVELESGTVGYGEDMLYYGWGDVSDADVEEAVGENAAELLWNDELGSLQIALFDAVAKELGAPVSELVGERQRESVPVGWWCIGMPASDWISECEMAIDRGYTAVKLKGRPWFDVRNNVAELCDAIPEWFEVGIDFNHMLRDAERALPILKTLDSHPQVTTFESPIPQDDIDGNRRLQRELDATIAQHNGRPAPLSELTQLQTGIAESFVLGTGGPNKIKREAGLADVVETPFWIQNLGQLTTIFWTHVAATTAQNTLPNVFCNHLFEESVLTEPIDVDSGRIPVPEGPGLGYEPDPDTVERLRVDRSEIEPDPDRLVVTEWPNREPMYFATGDRMDDMAQAGDFPYFEAGASTRVVPDDGSEEWARLQEAAEDGPVVGSPEWWGEE